MSHCAEIWTDTGQAKWIPDEATVDMTIYINRGKDRVKMKAAVARPEYLGNICVLPACVYIDRG